MLWSFFYKKAHAYKEIKGKKGPLALGASYEK
jgi:hypothetical protein